LTGSAPAIHRYGTHPSQFGQLSLPASSPPHPVVVLLHGGFWHLPWGLDLMSGAARDLVASGAAVWNLEYRRVGETGGGWPGTFNDVLAGFDALAGLPEAPDLDLSSVAVAGHSAGGHLALWLAAERGPLSASPVKLARAAGLAAVGDLRAAWRDDVGGSAIEALLGGTPSRHPDRYSRASPVERLPLGVDQLLVHGERDRVVPAELSRSYARAAQAAGDRVALAVVPRTGHMDVVDPKRRAWKYTAGWLAGAWDPAGRGKIE
jgi:acetyl esterase/lipase